MDAWAQELLEVFQARKMPAAEAVLQGTLANDRIPLKDYTINDMIQLVEGFYAMMAEQLSGPGREIWDTYINTVIPGLYAQGHTVSALVGQITLNSISVYNSVVPYISAANREKAGNFMANFCAAFNMEFVRIGFECGAKVPWS